MDIYIYLVYIGDDVMFFVFIFFELKVYWINWIYSKILIYLYYYYYIMLLMLVILFFVNNMVYLDVRYDGGIDLLFFLDICNVIVLDVGCYYLVLINVDGMIILILIDLNVDNCKYKFKLF